MSFFVDLFNKIFRDPPDVAARKRRLEEQRDYEDKYRARTIVEHIHRYPDGKPWRRKNKNKNKK